jgi:hypothetical protein
MAKLQIIPQGTPLSHLRPSRCLPGRTTEARRSIPRSARHRFLSRIQCLQEVLDRQPLPARKTQGSNRTGASSWPQPPKSRQPPGYRVQGPGGDLSSGSSESHTDVARRDESRRTPGCVNSSDCLHTVGRRGPVLSFWEGEGKSDIYATRSSVLFKKIQTQVPDCVQSSVEPASPRNSTQLCTL